MAAQVAVQLGAVRDVVLSLNSGAQATTASELMRGATPRHALMEPWLVPVGVVMYLVLERMLGVLCRTLGTTGKSAGFKLFALVHNINLCVYSTWTASNVIPLTLQHLRRDGAESLYCDANLWKAGLGYWGFLFYLSKYVELIDTVLLIWKGRKPSYLQVYHHAMTIVCAYLLQSSHATVMFLFVGLNATVHSVMYFYYALTVLGFRFGGKSLITSMQLAQFMFGILAALPVFTMRGGMCANEAQKVAVAAIVLHAAYLTKLFADFYRAAYGNRKLKEV